MSLFMDSNKRTRSSRSVLWVPTKAILGPRLQSSLEAQAIDERLLDRSDYRLRELYDLPTAYGQRGSDPRVLMYLCLFPDVTLTTSDFNLSKLERTGLSVDLLDSRALRDLNVFNYADFEIDEGVYRNLLERSHADAKAVCLAQKKDTLSLIESQIPASADALNWDADETAIARRFMDRAFVHILDLLRGWYLDEEGRADHSATPFQGLGAEEAIAARSGLPARMLTSAVLESWFDKLDEFYIRLVVSIFFSLLQGERLSVGRWWSSRRPNKELAFRPDDAVRTVQVLVQFKDELRVVPDPRSIPEAVEIGNSTEMIRIRELIDKWLDQAGSDNEKLEKKIRLDLAKASKELKRIKQYKEFSESPLVFGTKIVAGQIPIISNVITAIDAAGWAYERWIKKRNCWVAIK